MDDKRKHERLPEENRVAVTIMKSVNAPQLEEQTFFCPTEDISEGGLKLSVPSPIPVASQVELRVAFSKPLCSFKHIGEVRWSREENHRFPYSIGIKFDFRDEAEHEKWRMLMGRKIAPAQ